jgi:hypothetical protein
MKTHKMIALVSLSVLLFMGCQNQEDLAQDQESAISNEEVISDIEMDNIVDDVSTITEDQFGVQQSLTNKNTTPYKSMLPDCVKITTELSNGSWIKTVDFGTTGCTLANGNVLKGKIIISFANDFTSKEIVMTHKLDGFYHNETKIEGTQTTTRTLKSTALLVAIHPVNTLTLKLQITSKEGKVYERIGTRVREMVEGFSTVGNWEDNVFLVWGYSQSKLSNGTTYNTKVDANPLRFVAACKLPFPTKGTANHSKTNADNVIVIESKLDFGNGDCDKIATITIKGITKEITLKK